METLRRVREIASSVFPNDEADGHGTERVQAAFAEIESLGPDTLDAVVRVLDDRSVQKLLVAAGQPAIRYLRYALDKGGDNTQELAVGILGRMGDPALPFLESIFRERGKQRIRECAARCIAMNGEIRILAEALDDDEQELRSAAVWGLHGALLQLCEPGGQLRADCKPMLSLMREALGNSSPTVRCLALETLGLYGELTTDSITRALQDQDAAVRREAVHALYDSGIDHSTAPLLAKMLEDPDPEVSKSAMHLSSLRNHVVEAEAVADAIIDRLVVRGFDAPSEYFDSETTARALQEAISLRPRLRGHVLARLRDLAYEHQDSVRTRSVLVGRRISLDDFRALVQEKASNDPTAATGIFQLLGLHSGTDAILHQLAQTAPGDVQGIAVSQIQLLNTYYENAVAQARASFRWAIIFNGTGLACLLVVLGLLQASRSQNVAGVLAGIGSILSQFIAGTQFYLYREASKQLAHFHEQLDQTQRFLLANSVCESLDGTIKQEMRAELVRSLMAGKMIVGLTTVAAGDPSGAGQS